MTVAPSPLDRERSAYARYGLWIIVLAALVIGVALLVQHDVFRGSSQSNAVQGSGIPATQMRNLPAFRRVDLAGANNLAVHVDGAPAVAVRGDDNLIKLVTTNVRNGTLAVAQSRSFTSKSGMSVEVTVPSLDSVTLSGAGVLNVYGVRGSRFIVRVPGSGILSVTGAVTRLNATLSGTGDVRLQDLAARDVKANVFGSGRLLVQARRSLDASISGTGTILYSGRPSSVTQRITGNGALVAQ